MRVPKPKSRVVKSHNLRNLDGVKDVVINKASVEDRREGRGNKVSGPDNDNDYDDDKARRERYGFPF
jgi:hypothetical protein